MADEFDPDKYLAEKTAAPPAFNPDAYLQAKGVAVAPAEAAPPPTLGFGPTTALHAARHLAGGLGDKIIAAEEALSEKLHDKTGKTAFGDAYNRNLAFNDQLLEDSDKAHPGGKWLGNALGIAGNAAAFAVPGLLAGGASQAASALPRATQLLNAAKGGAKIGSILGGVSGYGNSRSDSALGTLRDTGVGSLVGGLAGGATPYAAEALGKGAQYLGSKAEDLAGWLKTHSLHPNPKLGEAMEDLPGGAVGVGKELLDRGIGGLTKRGTAEQIEKELAGAGKATTSMAEDYDAAGGAPISLDQALAAAKQHATALQAERTTRAAGDRLAGLVDEYTQLYGGKSLKAADVLARKRILADEAYGAKDALTRAGDHVAGKYGKEVSRLERSVDAELDKSLGPEFEKANLSYRRLLGARDAAERGAARTQSNHILGLLPYLAGIGGAAAGHSTPASIALGVGSTLAGKYGSQAGARALYSGAAPALDSLGGLLRSLPGAISSSAAASETTPALLAPDLETAARASALRRRMALAAGAEP